MRKILAVTMAFMLAAIVLSPALGYTVQSTSKPAFTAQSGALVNYSLTAGASAHELSEVAEKAVHEASVQSTRPAYSIKMGGLVPYSVKMEGAAKTPEVVEIPAVIETPAVAVNETNVTPTVPEANITPIVTPVEPKFVLSGMVFDDLNSSGILDQDEMGLANWTVDLENPEGSVIDSTMTAADGVYSFADLSAGDYIVGLVLPMGWELVSPLEGKRSATITDTDVAGIDFAVKVEVMPAPEVIPTPSVPEIPANATETLNVTPVLEITPALNTTAMK